MDAVAALSTGTKLVLGAGALLFIDLFLTWQTLQLDFGRGRIVTRALDAWDFWGLLIGLLTLAVLTIAILRETDTELVLGARWDVVPLALSTIVLALAVVKNVRDAESAWPSYLGMALAAVMVAGALLEWLRNRVDESPAQTSWHAQPVGPSDTSLLTDRSQEKPSARW